LGVGIEEEKGRKEEGAYFGGKELFKTAVTYIPFHVVTSIIMHI